MGYSQLTEKPPGAQPLPVRITNSHLDNINCLYSEVNSWSAMGRPDTTPSCVQLQPRPPPLLYTPYKTFSPKRPTQEMPGTIWPHSRKDVSRPAIVFVRQLGGKGIGEEGGRKGGKELGRKESIIKELLVREE